jgi:ribonuclease HI
MKQVTIYCDGAVSPNPGHGAWGAVMQYGEHRRVYGGYIGDQVTNNGAELVAAIEALERLKEPCEVTVYSDSQYLIETMNGRFQRGSNMGLWKCIDRAAAGHRVTWQWVRGHNGTPGQETAHHTANQYLREKTG